MEITIKINGRFMCGIPGHKPDEYVHKLRDRHDVTVSSIGPDRKRRTVSYPSVEHEARNAREAEAAAPEEYASARTSTLNAHYSRPAIVRAIYEAVGNMGFKTGNILEPSCGVGNFFGMLPESMAASKLYGVELDSISGRIAQQLYPKANITIRGFEKTGFPDGFFDLAIGNVPFGNYSLVDRRYDKEHLLMACMEQYHRFFNAGSRSDQSDMPESPEGKTPSEGETRWQIC